jgi:putative transposase
MGPTPHRPSPLDLNPSLEAIMAETPTRRAYPTDLTDSQRPQLEPLLRPNAGPGRPTTLELREIVNALLYMKQTGCAWRLLPHDFPNWTSVCQFTAGSAPGVYDTASLTLEQGRQGASAGRSVYSS